MTEHTKQPSQEPWRDVIETPVYPYTPADFQAIADALGVSQPQLSTLHVSRSGDTVVGGEVIHTFPLDVALQHAAQRYLASIHFLDNRPRLSQRRKVLSDVHTRAQRLSAALQAFATVLEHLDDASRADIIHRQHSSRPAFALLQDVEEVVMQWTMQAHVTLRPLIELLHTATQQLPSDKGGRPPDGALRSFIRLLLPIYERATGKTPRLSRTEGRRISGPLFRFVCACLQPLVPSQCPQRPSELQAEAPPKCPCQKLHDTPGDFQAIADTLEIPPQCPAYWCKKEHRENLVPLQG